MADVVGLRQVAAPPGGATARLAKRGAERLLWARVAVQRRLEARSKGERPGPRSFAATGVLTDTATWQRAAGEAGHCACRASGFADAPGSLLGINLEFDARVERDRVAFGHGDVTDTGLPTGHLDAITCMSVIEHGVPLEGFVAESARLLRPGGALVVSADDDQEPPDTAGKEVCGAPVHLLPEGVPGSRRARRPARPRRHHRLHVRPADLPAALRGAASL